MEKNSELNFKELYKCCDKSMFKFKTTEELRPIEYLIGQDRALNSINFALDIKVDG